MVGCDVAVSQRCVLGYYSIGHRPGKYTSVGPDGRHHMRRSLLF